MNKLLIPFIITALSTSLVLNAKNGQEKLKISVSPSICYASGILEKSYIPPPKEFLLKSGAEKKSDIVVKYSLFPDEAKVAFEFAISIWESIIESEIPIQIQANWRSQENGVLGSAGPSDYYSNFENAPRKNRFYPVAIAEKITRSEINPVSAPDIEATFNKDVNWYFGTDSLTPIGKYNFVTVALHEIGHGLGFTGFFYTSGGQGTYGNYNPGEATGFDIMILNESGDFLTDTKVFNMPSIKLNDALISNALYLKSPVAITENNGNNPRLYAPTTWNEGSSIYHLNDATYPHTSENSLMTHSIGKGETIHNPGPITMGILADIGWKHMYLDLEKPKDMEVKKPVVFNLNIKSDYELDTASLFVCYTYSLLKKRIDSIPLIPGNLAGSFSAILDPRIDTGNIYYYITASDKKNRTFLFPTEGINEIDTIEIGPDTEAPVINHTPIPYVILRDKEIKISTEADDNLGIDTVFVEYTLNGIPQIPFGLSLEKSNQYSGILNLNTETIKDGDEIAYQLVAIDSSLAKNVTRIPEGEKFKFKIEKIFDPVNGYFSDFNNTTADFIISDFTVNTEPGFKNGSLNSPHPYPSPEKDNAELNFSTMLKYPIILREGATMSFDEIVLVEPGEVLTVFGDDEFWDYVIVEGSKDDGKTWLPVSDGYDSGAKTIWKTNYDLNVTGQVSTTVGNMDWYINREINILENGNFKSGDTLLFRFRLFSDPYAHGWGWSIDNLRIQLPVSAPATLLSPGNILVYPNPFNDVFHVSILTNKLIHDLRIEVFNMYGQKINSLQEKDYFGEIKKEINLQNFSSGMYFVNVIENGRQVYSKKIIKN